MRDTCSNSDTCNFQILPPGAAGALSSLRESGSVGEAYTTYVNVQCSCEDHCKIFFLGMNTMLIVSQKRTMWPAALLLLATGQHLSCLLKHTYK